jgi:transposase
MQVCPRNRRPGRSRPVADTAQRRRPPRCGWSALCVLSWGPSRARCRGVARQLGYGVESVRSWVRQADIDDGYAPGVSTADSARIEALEQENRELKRANEILKRAASFFGAELDRQHKK